MKLALPYPVLPVSARDGAAKRLGISVDEVVQIAYGYHALRDGKVIDGERFREAFPDDDLGDYTAAQVLPADLVVRELEVARDPAGLFAPPITGEDLVAVDAVACSAYVARLTELGAPGIILRHARSRLQQACEVSERATRWQSLDELVTGEPPGRGAVGAPKSAFALPFEDESYETTPRDCAFVGASFLLQYRYASLVIGPDGEIRDVFPTCGLRAVGSDERYVLLVCGGGGAADSGYFGAEAFVRDTVEHRWLTGAIPETLPRFVAGTVGDMKWAIVTDVVQGVGYRTAPHATGDRCGGTFNSACARYAWGGERFVLEASTGNPVLDARDVQGILVSFAKNARGWRFVMLEQPDDPYEDELPSKLRVVDETGACIRELDNFDDATALALSSDGTRMLQATFDHMRVVDTDSGRVLGPTIDLRPLQAALALPEETDVWRRLVASVAYPAAVAAMTPEQARVAIADTWGDDPEPAVLEATLGAAANAPALPRVLPRTSPR